MDHAMRTCGALLLGLLLLGLPACGQNGKDTPENRLEAAKEHQEASPLKATIDNAINDMGRQFPPDKRDEFVKFMHANINMEEMEQKAVQAMADHFTLKEIQALTRFYRSPEGKAINDKYGDYLADLMPVIQSQLGKAGTAWLTQQQQQEQQLPPGHPATEAPGQEAPMTVQPPEEGGPAK